MDHIRTCALYARVSSRDQEPAGQLEALRGYASRRGCRVVEFTDHGVSGAKGNRPGLDALMESVRRRDVDAVAITKLDRLARSVRQLCDLAAELDALGVALVGLDQAIDTGTPTGRLVFHTLGAVAEFERELIRDRVREGRARARREGRSLGGRPRALDRHALARARRMRASGRSIRHVARVLGVGVGTVHRALARR